MQVVLSVTVVVVDLSDAIMQVTVSVVVMHLEVSARTYAGDSLQLMQLTLTFHKIDQKTCKCIISGLHFTTFVNIYLKLRYFEGRNYIQIG